MNRKIIHAYDFHGGGACPTQFYWHNEDGNLYYYFRCRHGVMSLETSGTDVESGTWKVKDTLVKVCCGDEYDTECTLKEFLSWMYDEGYIISIINFSEEIEEVGDINWEEL